MKNFVTDKRDRVLEASQQVSEIVNLSLLRRLHSPRVERRIDTAGSYDVIVYQVRDSQMTFEKNVVKA